MNEEGNIYRVLSKKEYESIASRILFEDSYIIAINKLPGEIVQGDKTGDEPLCDTLKAFIAQRDSKPGNVFMGVVHRLDRPVSGVVLFAKRTKSLERLNEMLRNSEIEKTYWALIGKRITPPQGRLENYLVRDERNNKSFVVNSQIDGAKSAILNYRTLRATDRYFLVEVELITGRHHQIRAQLSHAGCPIKGDLKYGAPRSNKDGSISLHSRSARFIHPVSKKFLHIEAPVHWPPLVDVI